jgi:hypothetical protein
MGRIDIYISLPPTQMKQALHVIRMKMRNQYCRQSARGKSFGQIHHARI